jgi:hypothetical protein
MTHPQAVILSEAKNPYRGSSSLGLALRLDAVESHSPRRTRRKHDLNLRASVVNPVSYGGVTLKPHEHRLGLQLNSELI